MKELVFATNNLHKLDEVKSILSDEAQVLSLDEIGCHDDIPETAETIEGNALQKARYVKELYGYDCFADDTGLEVEALQGAPGVRSARYAGDNHDSEANIDKLLSNLKGEDNRKARFRTAIALILEDKTELFEGIVNGRIIEERRGKSGFGYDPVFVPDGYDETFAEMSEDEKNKISHRARAVGKLYDRLRQIAMLIMIAMTLNAQNAKDWTTYLAYHEATGIAETNNRVFVLADGALYSYGKDDNEIVTYSKQNGLSDTEIKIIRYNPDTHTLVIVYTNGNIDLLDDDGFKNMPHLKNASNIQNKTVNDVYFKDNLAYLSSEFGILVLNLTKKEVYDTYRLEQGVNSVCIRGEQIIASTANGLLTASIKDNLLDKNVWKSKNIDNKDINGSEVMRIRLFKDYLIYCVKDKGLYCEAQDGTIKLLMSQAYIKDMIVQSNRLLAYTPDYLYVYSDIDKSNYVNINPVNDVTSLKEDDIYWIASGGNGLKGIRLSGDKASEIVSGITINSPKRNNNYFMTFNKNRLLIAGGGRYLDRYRIPGTLCVYENGEWTNLDEQKVNQEIIKIIGSESTDYLGVAVDPSDENHYFIATYGEGIIELRNNEFVELYNTRNSTLRSAIGDNNNYVRVGSVIFDKDGNLWSLNNLVKDAVNVRKASGEWVSLYYPQLNNADKIDKIMITSKGHKWINIPYEGGIFVLDDGGTIDDTSDDKYNFFRSFRDAQSSTGDVLAASDYLCMVEDLSGTVWIGTNIGLLRCGTPSRAIENPEQLSCSRLIRDSEAYFLSGESVTSLAVDADNQKWIGTATQGVFLINEDGSETIYNFNTDNSPLLSNAITTIAINNETGEVFFGSDKGLVSFKSGVVSGKASFSDVYAFPNPVRPDFSDKVTITGLKNNANVKITDISGNLIYQGRAVGSNMVWNCRSARGERVSSGVYLVIAATSDGAESVVTKIAVVK